MPNINLIEKDLTTPGGLNASSNIVYVPGYSKHLKSKYGAGGSNEITWPHLFNTTSEFLDVFSSDDVEDDNGNITTKGKFEYLKYGGAEGTTLEKSMVYALALLSVGLPVLYDLITTGKNWVESKCEEYIVTRLSNRASQLKDKNLYDIKFITTGGYSLNSDPITEIATNRGDCTALIDHTKSTTIYDITTNKTKSKFSAMFTPWCNFTFPSYDTSVKEIKIDMPGSLAYLLAFGTSIANGNANWLAAAGASRGYIPYLNKPLVNLTESNIETYQSRTGVSINPIAKINPYGFIIWGNRTLNDNASGLIASSFLNIRQLCNDIKKTLYVACKGITFDPNSDLLWIKFKSMITPSLDQMQTGNGIAGYQITKKKSTQKATLTAVIRIYPIEAVEDFDITLELADDFTNITDNLQ